MLLCIVRHTLPFVCFFMVAFLILKTAVFFFFFLSSDSNKLKAKETANKESLRRGWRGVGGGGGGGGWEVTHPIVR